MRRKSAGGELDELGEVQDVRGEPAIKQDDGGSDEQGEREATACVLEQGADWVLAERSVQGGFDVGDGSGEQGVQDLQQRNCKSAVN